MGTRDRSSDPTRGFQASYGLLRGWVDYTTHEVDGVTDWHRNGAPLDEPGYATDLIAAEAVRVIHAHDPSAPLFLVVSFNAPHPPLQAPPGAAPGSDARAVYAAMVERMDTRIGDVLDALDASGLAQNTLLWFLSDNGANPKFGGSNAPLAGGKYTCYEGGLRVPALLRWPGHLSPGASAAFVATVDLAPSLEALAGLARRSDVDGIDVLPALQAGLATPERDLLFAVDHANVERRAILRAPWKYITERRKDGTTLQLFNVVADPLEEHDLARQSPEIASALAARLAEASPAAAPRGQ